MKRDLVKLFKLEEQKQDKKKSVIKKVVMFGIAGVGAYLVKRVIDKADQKMATDIAIMVDEDLLGKVEDIYSDDEVEKWVETCKKEEKERSCCNCGKCKRKYVIVGENGKRQSVKEKVDLSKEDTKKETKVKEDTTEETEVGEGVNSEEPSSQEEDEICHKHDL